MVLPRRPHLIVFPMIFYHVMNIFNEVARQGISFLLWEAGFCLQVWGKRSQKWCKTLPSALLELPKHPSTQPQTQEQHSNQSQSPLLQALESQSQPSTAARPSGWQLPEKQSSIYDLKWNSLNRSQVPGQKNAKLGSLPGLPPPEELFLVYYACVWNGKVWIAEPCSTLHHMKGKSGPRSQSLRRLKQNNLKFIASLSYIARLCSSK